jgi:hypothetical protein
MLSATAITSNEPITPALGFADANSPKIMPKLVTVEDVAPKLNLLGSFGNFIKMIFQFKLFIKRFIQFSDKKKKKLRVAQSIFRRL